MGRLDLKRWPARSLVALLMLGLCAVGQAAPRAVHRPAHRPNVPLLNTTLPVPDMVVPDNGRRTATLGSPVLAHPIDHPIDHEGADGGRAADAGDAPERATGAPGTGDHATGVFPIQWRESREIAGPEIISRIRNYKRDGLPVVQLWEAGQSRVAIGLNPHGMPGIYFTHHIGG